MKAFSLTLAAAAAGLLLTAGSASATPLAPASPAPLGIDRFDGQVEEVHYRRRAVRRYHRPYYRRAPVVRFGYPAYVAPYYPRPYPYAYGYGAYPYAYGYAPTFSFGFRLR